MRIKCSLIGAFTVCVAGVLSVQVHGAPLPPATQGLVNQNPGLRAMFEEEHLVALYGAPFASDSDPGTSTQEFVEDFLAQHGDALGVEDPELTLIKSVTLRDDVATVFTYQQMHTDQGEQLPIHGTIVKIPVLLGATEKIAHIGVGLVEPPDTPLAVDLITGTEAVAVVDQSEQYGHLETFSDPEKVIFQGCDETLHRVWRFTGSDSDEAYMFFVDTNTSDIVYVADYLWEGTLMGTVTGHVTPCLPPDHPTCPGCCLADNPDNPDSCPTELGIEHATVRIGAQEQYTDECLITGPGCYIFEGLTDGVPVTVEAELVGQYTRVVDMAGPELVPSISATPTDFEADLLFNPLDQGCRPHEYDTAQVSAFYYTNLARDWITSLLPDPALNGYLLTEVNHTGTCNAYYSPQQDPDPDKLMFFVSTEEMCANSAMSSIIAHEYGHFIVDHAIGREPVCNQVEDLAGFHEGAADTVSAFVVDTPLGAYDWQLAGEPLRDIRHDSRLHDPSTLPDFCPVNWAPHCRGLALSGAFWDLRTEVGEEVADQLFADFLGFTVGSLNDCAIVALLSADDYRYGDGDLSNGSPHKDDILEIFGDLHGWPPDPLCETQGVEVEWQGPLAPYTSPEEGVDYIVEYDTCPPDVTLITVEKDEVPVDRWFIGRVDDRTDGPNDIGDVTAEWDPARTEDHNVVVKVGTTPSTRCRSVGSVVLPAQSDQHYSSVKLDLPGRVVNHLQPTWVWKGTCIGETSPGIECDDDTDCLGDDTCDVSAVGKGGRVAATVAGPIRSLTAQGIGEDQESPGSLAAADIGYICHLEEFPTGSSFDAHMLNGWMIVSGDMDGTFHVHETMSGALGVGGDLSGDILLDGHLLGIDGGKIQIFGDVTGNIHADADGIDGGGFHGSVSADGVFNGDICGDNLIPGEPLPSFIDLNFGPEGTVCLPGFQCPAVWPPIQETEVVSKNRYMAFAPSPENDGSDTALRVTASELPSAFDDLEGERLWVAQPFVVTEVSSSANPTPEPTITVARLQCEPYYTDWSTWVDPDELLYIVDDEIVPSTDTESATYVVQAIDSTCYFQNEVSYSPGLDVGVARFGDVTGGQGVPDGTVDFVDISGVVDKFKNEPWAISKTRTDLRGDLPDLMVNFVDISAVVDAFRGKAYSELVTEMPAGCD